MSLINQNFGRLDTKTFKSFLAAVETRSFTEAAELAATTQSNVSQQIAKLEDQLGTALFKRLGKEVQLTEPGEQLVKFINKYYDTLTDFMNSIKGDGLGMEGLVRYAMPPSCLLSPHFPMLLIKRLETPSIEINIELIANNEIFKHILEGKIDFGFVTEKIEHPLLTYKSFCLEEYILITSVATNFDNFSSDTLFDYKYIKYPGFSTYINYWLSHFFPERPSVNARSLYFSGEISSIDGAIKMVEGGLGISVFPRHCVQEHIDTGRLVEYPYRDQTPLFNNIYIVEHKILEPSKRVATVIDWFMEMVCNK